MDEIKKQRLYRTYKEDFESLYDRGVATAVGPYVLLRGITLGELGTEGIALPGTSSFGDVRQAVAYEVVSVGAAVPEWIRPGMHCRVWASHVTPTQRDGQCRYVRCDHEHVTECWDPEEAAK